MKLKGLACFVPGLADRTESKSGGDLASLSIEELEALIEERFRAALKQEINRFQARRTDRCIYSVYYTPVCFRRTCRPVSGLLMGAHAQVDLLHSKETCSKLERAHDAQCDEVKELRSKVVLSLSD